MRKSKENVKFGWRHCVQSPLQKLIFGNSGQKLRKSIYQSFLFLSNFVWFSYFLPNILSLIVVYQQSAYFLTSFLSLFFRMLDIKFIKFVFQLFPCESCISVFLFKSDKRQMVYFFLKWLKLEHNSQVIEDQVT